MELHITSRGEWRQWLQDNHESQKEIWLVYYKKPSGRSRIPYNDAVEGALCFGWIDGMIKSISDDYYIQRFTPRRRGSKWSELNVSRAERMISLGLMMPAGLKAWQEVLDKPSLRSAGMPKDLPDIPEDLMQALVQNETAHSNFMNFRPSGRRNYINWLNSAVRMETRAKRIISIIERAEKNIQGGMM